MNEREARRLAARMVLECRTITVTGYRHYRDGRRHTVEVEAVDRRTGYSFVVRSPEDWK